MKRLVFSYSGTAILFLVSLNRHAVAASFGFIISRSAAVSQERWHKKQLRQQQHQQRRRSCTLPRIASNPNDLSPGWWVVVDSQRRRDVVLSIPTAAVASFMIAAATVGGGAQPSIAAAADSVLLDLVSGQANSRQLENGLLESRVLENVQSPPPYGMEGPDVYYPEWLLGSWKVNSVTVDVQAPCGVQLFGGGNATYNKARNEIGTALNYESRFLLLDNDHHIVADREFNVKSIAKVAMGSNSVVDVSLATPNKFSCLLAPNGSPSLLTVDLIVLNRRQEDIDETHFHCSEVVREIVSPVGGPSSSSSSSGGQSRPVTRSPTLLKEIETTSLYTLMADSKISCQQRSATFLLPSQQDPIALRMWEMSRGRPIDVRFYNITYTKR